jgi:hypothetical protein
MTLLARGEGSRARYGHHYPGSLGSPLAKGNDLNRAVYTRWASHTAEAIGCKM